MKLIILKDLLTVLRIRIRIIRIIIVPDPDSDLNIQLKMLKLIYYKFPKLNQVGKELPLNFINIIF